MKICVYTCNFGNYRNELKKTPIDTINFCNNIDYYIFTDNTSLISNKWNIVLHPIINNNYRWTTKYIKFGTPDIIKQYDIIIWCDTKCLTYLNNINSIVLQSFINKNNYKLYNIKHPDRNTPQQELIETIKRNIENKNDATIFLQKIEQIKFNTPLPDTCFIIRKNDPTTNTLFENVYDLMRDNNLKRDQNIYNYAIHTTNYEINNILFIKDISELSFKSNLPEPIHNIFMKNYNLNIQIHKNVIIDVLTHITPTSKMLVFGLGYDSKMWYECNNKNTFFVENKDEYINLNKDTIPETNIIKYDYPTTCSGSTKLTDDKIKEFAIPEKILNQAPFDIIIIDGPEGWSANKPGRLIPCYWSTILSKQETIIYIDDITRPLEKYCVQKYYKDYKNKVFNQRGGCIKIFK